MNNPLQLDAAEIPALIADFLAMEKAGNATQAGADHAKIIEELAVKYTTSEVVVWEAIMSNTLLGPC